MARPRSSSRLLAGLNRWLLGTPVARRVLDSAALVNTLFKASVVLEGTRRWCRARARKDTERN